MSRVEIYRDYLAGEIRHLPDAYLVCVGPWQRRIPVTDYGGDWLAAHDAANNWRLRKTEKFESFLSRRKTVPVLQGVLPRLLRDGYGPFICKQELDDDAVMSARIRFLPGRYVSSVWPQSLQEQARYADDTHRMYAHDAAFAATEWGALSGRRLSVLAEMFCRTDIGNLAYLALHAPEPFAHRFQELHERLAQFVKAPSGD